MIDVKERGAGPAVTFLHGFSLDARMWSAQTEALSDDYRTLAVTLPGFGRAGASDRGEQGLAEAVLALLDARGVDQTHLVGLSLGGAVATDLALAAPGRVLSLALADAVLLKRPAQIGTWRACAALAKENKIEEARRVWMTDDLFGQTAKQATLQAEIAQMVDDYAGGHWAGLVVNRWLEPDPAARLASLAMDTLVIDGEEDTPSFRAMAAEYAERIPRARRVSLPGVGHMANMEAPARFNDLLREHLSARSR